MTKKWAIYLPKEKAFFSDYTTLFYRDILNGYPLVLDYEPKLFDTKEDAQMFIDIALHGIGEAILEEDKEKTELFYHYREIGREIYSNGWLSEYNSFLHSHPNKRTYYIHIVPEDDFGYINIDFNKNVEGGRPFLGTKEPDGDVQTSFTQKEIHSINPAYLAFTEEAGWV